MKPPKAFSLYLVRIILPYVIMVVGYMLLSLHLPVRDGITELTWPVVLRVVFITSIGSYWFFRVIIICGALYYISVRVAGYVANRAKRPPGQASSEAAAAIPSGSLPLFALLLLAMSHLTPALPWDSAFYYFLGACMRHLTPRLYASYPQTWMALPVFAFILFLDSNNSWNNVNVVMLVLCFLSFTPKMRQVSSERFWSTCTYVGRNTLPIYMFHPVFTMMGKYMLPAFRMDGSGTLHALAVILLSLAGSLAMAKIMDRLHLSWLFGRQHLLR